MDSRTKANKNISSKKIKTTGKQAKVDLQFQDSSEKEAKVESHCRKQLEK